ncbi:molybdopterin-synthase adenylyltransferase MoeB [Pyruvatibacter mobilis]|uniref:Molybdopterin-synthase adenylyltransferase n=1 Tax=Pyruvatibacter mobilis TaxID=1712261 RepID=A0A845QA34_9HYPH|nr:HesA/MoeB/ThiF family protein [Pyruvatibacter mobilis]NBG95040.1 molybdopterin-synthase adenylyltransferase MoeB [Pyruvatibacter mobilis]QJD76236.1 HesA/MoeB/ThiF family protein [Pyruvatibacter mobilis]GGD22387.1 thiamine biosynthesis protein ThiF [Pyruvatibacter mobilis]
MALSGDQLERYARHILLKEIGGPGQQALLAARVLIIGAGGLGSPAALYLAASGVGTIGLVDDDHVSLSNLQRQIAHTTAAVGEPKTESAARTLTALNPDTRINQHTERLTSGNVDALVSGYDMVLDGCDNFETRFLVSDACERAQIPLVSGAVGRFDGQLAVFHPWETDADGTPGPGYRDLVPEMPPPGSVPTCEEAGVVGALTGVIGSMMAMEAIKEITGAGTSMAGSLLLYDALDTRIRRVKLRRDPHRG